MAAGQVRWQVLDAALAVALTAAAVAEVAVGGYGPVTALFAAVVTVALKWRRSFPLTVLVVEPAPGRCRSWRAWCRARPC